MKLDSVLKSNHDLKKNGYHIVSKLHKLERCKGVDKAYCSVIDDTYYFVLSIRALFDIIKAEYPEADKFIAQCNGFLSHLDEITQKKSKINKSVLASFLHAYTTFFNQVKDYHHRFKFDQKIRTLWNIDCLMAYIAVWGKNY